MYINKSMFSNLDLVQTPLVAFCLSVGTSLILNVPPPPTITPENIINLITQSTLLITALFGFYLKLQERKKNKKNK